MTTETDTEESAGSILLRLDNAYSDGHESSTTKSVPAPEDLDDPDEVQDWWDTTVFNLTGDGHGAENPDLGSFYTATVIKGPAQLLGKTYEWD